MELVQPVEWQGDKIRLIDQTRLPAAEVHLEFTDYRDIASAIKELRVRGAPAIGITAAYGLALGALQIKADSPEDFLKQLNDISRTLASTRPTARNLFRALERMEKAAEAGKTVSQLKESLVEEAKKIHQEEIKATRAISRYGAELVKDGMTILTHCDTGPLATAGYGTAAGIIIYAHEQGKNIKVMATETRPLLQGARLTTWELQRAGVPVTLITDSMAGYFLSRKEISCVVVGADRIAANGDTANKIGTYTLAVLAKENNVPFYVAAPTSTVDPSLPSGSEIVIEERCPDEVTNFQGVSIAPDGTPALNPAFDITPHKYITAIITEKGIVRKPFKIL